MWRAKDSVKYFTTYFFLSEPPRVQAKTIRLASVKSQKEETISWMLWDIIIFCCRCCCSSSYYYYYFKLDTAAICKTSAAMAVLAQGRGQCGQKINNMELGAGECKFREGRDIFSRRQWLKI